MNGKSNGIDEVRRDENAIVVALAGEMDFHRTPAMHAELAAICKDRPPRLVINLEGVTHMDSSGLGMLIEVFRRVRAYDGEMVFCGLPERVRGLFEITRLDRLFAIFATEAEALAG